MQHEAEEEITYFLLLGLPNLHFPDLKKNTLRFNDVFLLFSEELQVL
jgi:hypothetical protein